MSSNKTLFVVRGGSPDLATEQQFTYPCPQGWLRLRWRNPVLGMFEGIFMVAMTVKVSMVWFIGKNYDAGRDWGQEEKRMTEDEMARWHH